VLSEGKECAMSKSNENRTFSRHRDSVIALSQAWAPFGKRLTSVLSKMKEDQYLVISAKSGDRYIQFACQGGQGMRVEVSSNNFLKGNGRLKRRQTSWLCTNGWNAPTVNRTKATPKKDPNGSPNYFVDLPVSIAVDEIAEFAIEALMHGLEIPNPALLAYEAFNSNGVTFQIDELRQVDGEMPRPIEDMFGDPEPHDEDDPEYKEEMFATMKAIGCKPEGLIDPEEAAEYQAWLEKNS
jgi:hypothetical protein